MAPSRGLGRQAAAIGRPALRRQASGASAGAASSSLFGTASAAPSQAAWTRSTARPDALRAISSIFSMFCLPQRGRSEKSNEAKQSNFLG